MFDVKKWLVPHLRDAALYSQALGIIAEENPEYSRMCLNENPLPPSSKVVDAITDAAKGMNYYPGMATSLREKLATKNGVDVENVFVTNGSSEILDGMMRAFLNPGDEVLLPTPTFSLFNVRASVAGGKVVGIPFSEEGLDYVPQNYFDAVTDKTKLIVVVQPNNPTGAFFPEDELRKLLDLGIPTCIDEAYLEFHPEVPTMVHLMKEYPNAFVSHTMSKGYGLAGMRFGYMLAQPAMLEVFQILAQPWIVGMQTLAAAEAALEDEETLARNVAYMTSWMNKFTELFKELGLKPIHPAGNFMMIDATDSGKTSKEIFEAGLKEGIILKTVGELHGRTGYFRLTPGTEADNEKAVVFFKSYFG